METKIRVVCLVRGFEPVTGKAGSRRLFHLMHMFKEGGANLLVLAGSPEEGQNGGVVEMEGIPIHYLCSKKDRHFYGLKYTLRALREIRKIESERIVLYSNGRDDLHVLWYWVIAKILHAPLLCEFNELPISVINGYSVLRRFVEHLLLKIYDGGTVMTENLIRYYHSACRKHFQSVHIPMTVDWDSLANEVRPSPFPFEYIAYAGNMFRLGGGVEYVVQSFARIACEYPNLHLVLIGRGSDSLKEKFLEMLPEEARERVHFLFRGKIPAPEMPMYVKNAKALMMLPLPTKQQEGCFPTKLGEYLASGVPTIISRVGNPVLCLKDREQVFFVPPGDVDATATALREVMNDYPAALSVAKRGQEFAKATFHYANYSQRLGDWAKEFAENWYHRQWMRYGFPMILVRGLDPILQAPVEFIRKIRTRVLCAFWGIKTGRRIVFRGPIFIRTRHKGQVVFGDDVRFNATDHSNAVGLTNTSIIDTRLGGKIIVGSHTGFSSSVLSSKSEIRIGEKVFVGGNVRILDHDFHALKPEERRHPMLCGNIRTKPIHIEDECFIGTNAMILKGTHLGARTIVAAGSVVFGLDVPPDSMVKGNPAVICGRREG